MTNPLTSHVQSVPLYPVVWYRSYVFPTVLTDAVLVDGDGDLLLVDSGCQLRIISVQQVERITRAHGHEAHELLGQAIDEFDNEEKRI